jgi:hypothetical protein
VGLARSKDSANYAGGSIASRRKSFAGQGEGDDPTKKYTPVLQVGRLDVTPTTSPFKKEV